MSQVLQQTIFLWDYQINKGEMFRFWQFNQNFLWEGHNSRHLHPFSSLYVQGPFGSLYPFRINAKHSNTQTGLVFLSGRRNLWCKTWACSIQNKVSTLFLYAYINDTFVMPNRKTRVGSSALSTTNLKVTEGKMSGSQIKKRCSHLVFHLQVLGDLQETDVSKSL